ncbi:MAG: GIY-YIG nuclease family protein, partial [Candidatus Aminicenantes bacterium]|nr:GIY-YIG nuclease family protein [Candidatus Aminicenantes bacterium]
MRVSNLKKENLLSSLEVLIVDCQATGSNPAKGRLLEIGWARVRASSRENNEKITSYLIKLPHDEIIPTAVKRITGISAEDAARGLPPKKAWKKLFRAVKRTAAANKRGLCPTVIHFARFEEPYLREMHQKWSPGKPFPFEIICTHRVIKRLLPQLPRKGLRAAAGYLGYSVPELRRSASHIEATNFTWKETVKLLEQRGVRTLPELREWLEAPPAVSGAGSAGRVYPMAAKERSGLPGLPGVYRMLRSNGDLLYIGKATSLKQRVGSYFRKSAKHSERTLEMLTQANKLDITVTGSALEAALLESDEIKKHSPPYNAALRKGERRLFYFSSDLRQSAPGVDKVYRLGPVVSVQTLQSLAGIIELLEKGTGQFQAKLNKSFVQTFSK